MEFTIVDSADVLTEPRQMLALILIIMLRFCLLDEDLIVRLACWARELLFRTEVPSKCECLPACDKSSCTNARPRDHDSWILVVLAKQHCGRAGGLAAAADLAAAYAFTLPRLPPEAAM